MSFQDLKITLTVGEIMNLAKGKMSEEKLKARLFDLILAGKTTISVPQIAAPARTSTLHKPGPRPTTSYTPPPQPEQEELEEETVAASDEVEEEEEEEESVVHANAAIASLLNRGQAGKPSAFSDSKKPATSSVDEEDDEDDGEDLPQRRAPMKQTRNVLPTKSNSDEDRLKSIQNKVNGQLSHIPGLRR